MRNTLQHTEFLPPGLLFLASWSLLSVFSDPPETVYGMSEETKDVLPVFNLRVQ